MGNIFDKELPEAEAPLLPLVQALFPAEVPIRLVLRREGMSINDKWEMELGMRAGPGLSIGNLLHEIGHLIDIDDARASKWNWGLFYPEQEVFGRLYPQPITPKGAVRECHVIAWQMVLAEMIGLPFDPMEWVSSLQWLTDFMCVPRKRVPGESMKQWDNRRFAWLMRKVWRYRAKINAEMACDEIIRKSYIVRDHLNTRRREHEIEQLKEVSSPVRKKLSQKDSSESGWVSTNTG
jgi:hypothetical protein